MEDKIKNTVEEFINEQKKKGKVTIISKEDSSKIFDKIDKDLKEYRKDLLQKERESEVRAARIKLSWWGPLIKILSALFILKLNISLSYTFYYFSNLKT